MHGLRRKVFGQSFFLKQGKDFGNAVSSDAVNHFIILAADLFARDRWDDFVNALYTTRTRELVRTRTSATKSGEIKQIRKGADLLDTSSFRAPSQPDSFLDQESVSDTSMSSAALSESANDSNASATTDGHLSASDATSQLVDQSRQFSTPVRQPLPPQLPNLSPPHEQAPSAMHAGAGACTCVLPGSSFVTQAAHCLTNENIELCQYCSAEN